jgi:hypothetical protein
MSPNSGRFLVGLSDEQRIQGRYTFTDTAVRHRWTYRPRSRAGLTLGELTRAQRKAVHAMLTTVLSPHAYAQAAAIMALEDVLDRAEDHQRDRHHTDYWIVVFGEPSSPDRWGWRFEGHHLSLNITVIDGQLATTPCFFGVNPATVRYRDEPILAPLSQEEHLARTLLGELTTTQRRLAVVSDAAPADIRTRTAARIDATVEPRGIPMTRLDSAGAQLLEDLVAFYLSRFRPELAEPDINQLRASEIYFAWEGPLTAGGGHYYRIHAPNLLIEYDNTANNANHVHSVLRRPTTDFGADLLTEHHERHHHDPSSNQDLR